MTWGSARSGRARIAGLRDVAEGAVRRLLRPHAGDVPASGLPWGVNLIGYHRSALGLAEAARYMLTALEADGVPAAAVDIRAAPGVRRESEFEMLPLSGAPYSLNVIHATADGLRGVVRRHGRGFMSGRRSAGVWWWEVDPAPAAWREASRLLDEIWVCSAHVHELLADVVSPPLRRLSQAVPMPRPSGRSRSELGLPDGLLFLTSFDYGSSPARKNPAGAIEAFRRAFPRPGEASLVIRSLGAERHRRQRRALEALSGGRPDILLLDGYLSSPDRDAVLSHCDCYVSLHRAEGFGLPLAEAMRLGKPVIATGWSGNLDFMTRSNSYLVDCRPSVVGRDAWPYPPTGHWADPDVGHAAELMRHVVDDPAEAARRGCRGAEDVARAHDPVVVGAVLRTALASLGSAGG